jgi:hypothetical protein
MADETLTKKAQAFWEQYANIATGSYTVIDVMTAFAEKQVRAERDRVCNKIAEYAQGVPRDENGFLQTYFGLDWVIEQAKQEQPNE